MSLRLPDGFNEYVRTQLQDRGIPFDLIKWELFGALERIDEDPSIGVQDTDWVFGGAYIYQFRLERMPLIVGISIAYDVEHGPDDHVVTILDFAPRLILDADQDPDTGTF